MAGGARMDTCLLVAAIVGSVGAAVCGCADAKPPAQPSEGSALLVTPLASPPRGEYPELCEGGGGSSGIGPSPPRGEYPELCEGGGGSSGIGLPLVRVWAAASLTEAVGDLCELFAEQGRGACETNFAATSVLARQIEAGGPADVFLAADREWADRLVDEGLLAIPRQDGWVGNALVVVVAGPSKESDHGKELLCWSPVSPPPFGGSPPSEARGEEGLAGSVSPPPFGGSNPSEARGEEGVASHFSRIAMADPTHVPAGKYAKAALDAAGLWPQVEERMVAAMDVRAALAMVESGSADAGIVYRTDAVVSPRVHVACEIPMPDGGGIRYAAGLVLRAGAPCAGGGRPGAGRVASAFLDHIYRPESAVLLRKRGFSTPWGNP